MDTEITEDKAAEVFKRRFKPRRSIEYISFCGTLENNPLFEIWYKETGEFKTSFVGHDRTDFFFVESVSQLLTRINDDRRLLENRVELMKGARFRLIVAAVAFLIGLATLIVIAFKASATAQTGTVIAAIVGVVASGGLFFFGAWIPGAAIVL
jgi:hypothetical protein